MLQSIKTEVREFGNLLVRSPDAKDSAGILRTLLAGEKIVTQTSVTTWHEQQSSGLFESGLLPLRNCGQCRENHGPDVTERVNELVVTDTS
jgi:hypothetical protein